MAGGSGAGDGVAADTDTDTGGVVAVGTEAGGVVPAAMRRRIRPHADDVIRSRIAIPTQAYPRPRHSA
jgi:hypothetical protein